MQDLPVLRLEFGKTTLQESGFLPLCLEAIEREGPMALFTYAALDLRRDFWMTLRGIIEPAALRAGVGESDKQVDDIADQINEMEDVALTEWIAQWNLDLPAWFRPTAIKVMLLLTFLSRPTIEQAPFPPFTHPGVWPGVQPGDHDRKVARMILEAAFKAHLDTYLDVTYAELERQRHISPHYEWVVRYQLGGESAQAIATSAGVQRSSVEQQIKRILKDLELPQRAPLRTGPKPKTRITQVEQ